MSQTHTAKCAFFHKYIFRKKVSFLQNLMYSDQKPGITQVYFEKQN
jgi:hypothetical protein